MMTTNNLDLRVDVNTDQALSELDRLLGAITAFTQQAAAASNGANFDGWRDSIRDAEREIRDAGDGLDDVGDAARDAGAGIRDASEGMSGFSRAASLAASAIAALGVGSLVSGALDTYRSFESLNASLKTVTGSASAGAAAFAEIQKFAAETPFTLDQSVMGFQKLKALGLDPSMASLRSYGNTAAAMGKDMTDMIEAVADASTGEFERLKEFGIKSSSEGDKVTFTFQGVETTVKKSSEEIQKYLQAIGNTQFATAMADQAETLDGKISNLEDSWTGLQVKIVESTGVADLAKASIAALSDVLAVVGTWIEKASVAWAFFKDDLKFSDDTFFIGLREIGKAIDTIATAIEPAMPYITEFATGFGIALAGLAGVAGIGALVSSALGMIGTAFTAVGAIIMANPVALTIAAIAGAGYLIYKNWDGIAAFAASTWDSVKNTVSGAWNSIKNTVTNSTIGKQLASLWGEVTATFGPLVTGYINLQKSLWSGIGSLASTGMSMMGSAVSEGWETVKLTFISYAPALRDAFDSAWSGLSNIASAAWQSITAVIGAAWDTVRGLLTAGLRLLRGDFSGAWDAIMETVRSLGQRMQDYFAGLPSLMIGYGRDIVAGLTRGISSAADSAVAAAKSLASDVAGSISSFFKRGSPSRLMMEYGNDVGDGLAIGIKNNDKAATEAKKKAKGIADAFKQELKALEDQRLKLTLPEEDYYKATQSAKGFSDAMISQLAALKQSNDALEKQKSAAKAYADELKRINSDLAKAGLGTKDQYKLDAGAKGFSNTQSNQLAEKQMAAEFAKITSQNKDTIQQLKLTETGYLRAKLARDGFTKSQISGLVAQQQEIKWFQQAQQAGYKAADGFVSITRIKAIAATGYIQELIGSTASANKTMFEINKAAAIANAVLNARETVVSAFKWGVEVGGVPFGYAMGGVALAAQMANIQSIASQSFGGGGSADAGGGGSASAGGGEGGSAGAPSSGAAASTPQGGSVMIALQGNDNTQYSKKQVRDLIRQINEAVGDGARLAVA